LWAKSLASASSRYIFPPNTPSHVVKNCMYVRFMRAVDVLGSGKIPAMFTGPIAPASLFSLSAKPDIA